MRDGGAAEGGKQGDGPRTLGLLQATTSMLGSRLDPEWSQDGPFIDPRDTTQVVRGQNTIWRAFSSHSSIC